jgi:virulence-associated protein VapD
LSTHQTCQIKRGKLVRGQRYLVAKTEMVVMFARQIGSASLWECDGIVWRVGTCAYNAPTTKRSQIMYAITFDLDMENLKATYHNDSYTNAYTEISRVLVEEFGFDWQQGSVYFGGTTVDAVTCVMAAQELATRFDWFTPSVRDIRMLRIEDNNDLTPAIERVTGRRKPSAVFDKAA